MVGAGNLRLPHAWCHTLVPWPDCPWESGGHWVCSWFRFLRREPSLCALKLLCPANQGTANGDDWKNCFKSLVWAKAPMLLDARTPIAVSATPLKFSFFFLLLSPVLCSLQGEAISGSNTLSCWGWFQMNIQLCSELYFDMTVIAELYWNKCVDRKGLGNIAAFTYSMYKKCRSMCSYAGAEWQGGWL